jgi:uncharacterized membrane protein
MMFPGSHYIDASWMGWMAVGSALFWIMLAAIAVFAIRRLGSRDDRDDSLKVLDQRLARGDIDADDYRSRRTLILGR